MQLLNLFQRPHITLLVVAIVITVHSALAMPPPKEEKVTCDEYFYPSKDPHTYMCRSNHVTHKCPIDSCKVDDKAWPQATFKNCDLLNKQRQIITGHTIPSVTPYQYHTTQRVLMYRIVRLESGTDALQQRINPTTINLLAKNVSKCDMLQQTNKFN
ncbi:hypothetical protein KEM48_003384 [Puccinia striiformis f. sp. tritici PST-130]|nr:hypothetical protein KEM48_003384 [Puccinia striiformis f. sp. tritici PST-130]